MELTILMPCLNEVKTVAVCVRQAAAFLLHNGIDGEVLVVDNGSTDTSVKIAEDAGARVIYCQETGYGSALRYGIEHAAGTYVIMGDCDCSYPFDALEPFIRYLRSGADMVIGDRFALTMEKGAMSFSHRYIGVPALSFLGRRCFHTDVHDFHCGLRAVRRESFLQLSCHCRGMEFATEMIGRAALKSQKISQVPVAFYRDKRGHGSHLRTVRDGIRHICLIWELSRENIGNINENR